MFKGKECSLLLTNEKITMNKKNIISQSLYYVNYDLTVLSMNDN